MTAAFDPLATLQSICDEAWKTTFTEDLCPKVFLFGSRQYGLAAETSDWDFALVIPTQHSPEAKVLRAKIRSLLCQRGLTSWQHTEDQFDKHTLQWKFHCPGKSFKQFVTTSLNVSPP